MVLLRGGRTTKEASGCTCSVVYLGVTGRASMVPPLKDIWWLWRTGKYVPHQRGPQVPGSCQSDRSRPRIVRNSDFSRETWNQDFPIKYHNFEMLEINSNFYELLCKPNKPMACIEDCEQRSFGVYLRDAKRASVLGSGNAVETEEGYPGVLLPGWTVKPWNLGCRPGSQVSLFLLLNLTTVLLKEKNCFLAVPGLSCDTWIFNLCCGMQDL